MPTADPSVMPILTQALACLTAEANLVADPPDLYQMRPGASFSPMIDNNGRNDECCIGIGWVRMVAMSPTRDFPLPDADTMNCPPDQWAVQIELGLDRCVPLVSDIDPSKPPTTAQWLAATQRAMDDGAALRRAACCLGEVYGWSYVLVGTLGPLENEGTCTGMVLGVTVAANACDCD